MDCDGLRWTALNENQELCSEQATSGTEDATREAQVGCDQLGGVDRMISTVQAGRDKQEIAQRAQANAADLVRQAEAVPLCCAVIVCLLSGWLPL